MSYTPKSPLEFFASAETSKEILEYLTKDVDFNVPDVNLDPSELAIPAEILDAFKNNVPKVRLEDLTDRNINGAGVFDALMEVITKHMKRERTEGRIVDSEYGQAYVQAMNVALQSAVQFLLQKDAAYWGAIKGRMDAMSARLGIYQAQVQLAIARAQANTHKAQYAGSVIQLATADANYKSALNNHRIQEEQIISTHEQAEAHHAQTADNRIDNKEFVVGSIGKQKDLYSQQIDAYKKDALYKATKMYADVFSSQAAVNDSIVPPQNFTAPSLEKILSSFETKNELK